MAEQCSNCSCTSYSNLCCCIAQDDNGDYAGISVVQPQCQVVPSNLEDPGGTFTVLNNPCFDGTYTYFTYKFITDCRSETNSISHVDIPVCQDFEESQIRVFEKIDCCGSFTEITDFELLDSDPALDPSDAPEDFQWLKIESGDPPRFEKGVCVTYLLAVTGNTFVASEKPIAVKASTNSLFALCDDCFLVPGCTVNLSVGKCCTIEGDCHNQINYNVTLSNSSSVDVTVRLTDQLEIPAGVTLRVDDLDGCSATVNNVPVNQGDTVSGLNTIIITCDSIDVNANDFTIKTFSFTVGACFTCFNNGSLTINNQVTDVTSQTPGTNLTVTGLPATADITLSSTINCLNPCDI